MVILDFKLSLKSYYIKPYLSNNSLKSLAMLNIAYISATAFYI
jgi:hypothetical protein